MKKNKNISIIVAIAQNNAIGKDNKLLWHISEDLKRFKKITTGHTIVMGKNTFHSLPNGPLANRVNMVITDVKNERFEGCEMAYSIEEALEKADPDRDIYIIGGGMIYKQFLPLANRLYLTVVHQDFEADTFFPDINYDEWITISEEKYEASESTKFAYSYLILERK
ncbi:MAG: dihydrofolate reductase [Bacteroidales bacterium]|nr:dihydrofolate reductase [Bacteroidales bacterium]MCF8406086.1 dihydrofolate reductase [Bacteroidales bacterium]